jgi:hypothetical protein
MVVQVVERLEVWERLAKLIGLLLVAMQAERVAMASLVCPDYKFFN